MEKLKVIKIDEIPEQAMTGGIFVGTAKIKNLVSGSKDLFVTIVHFPKGVKNVLHNHAVDQVLYILMGKGIVATEKEEVIAVPGMVFFVPAGENHWHGATDDSDFIHISIMKFGATKITEQTKK